MSGVVVTEDGRVCRLRLNRPHKLNALDAEMYRGLRTQLERLADHPEISVLVISGEGRAFSAGIDISSIGSAGSGGEPERSWVRRRHAMGVWQRLLDLLERLPQVTVASIHGHCVGGAALLAVACDLRIGAADILVRIPELALGLPLTWAGIPRLARELGLPRARDLVMTGRVLDGRAALTCGFVQRVVPAAELANATDALVADLLGMPPGPLALARAMFSALSVERLGAAGWADPDILGWSGAEDESRAAAREYARRRRSPGGRDGAPTTADDTNPETG